MKILEKALEVFDPIIDAVKRRVANLMTRFRNWRLRHNGFKFRTKPPTLVPEQPMPAEPVLVVPTVATS